MSTSLSPLLTQFKSNVKFQVTPIPYNDLDYLSLLLQGVKRLYIDKGIEDDYITDYYTETIESVTTHYLKRDLSLTEQEYIIIASEIAFLKQIKAEVNQIVGYSSDALSITGANKPYENISQDIAELENRLSQLGWKFCHK